MGASPGRPDPHGRNRRSGRRTKPPRDPWPDATLPLLRDRYRYRSRRAHDLGSDAHRLRILGQAAYALTGLEGAAPFYGPWMRRRGAVPGRVRRVLFGPKGVVQTLDGGRTTTARRCSCR